MAAQDGWLEHATDLAFERAGFPMAIAGLDGRIRRTNQAFRRLAGQGDLALIHEPLATLIHPEDQEAFAHSLAQAEADTRASFFTGRWLRPNADPVNVELTLSMLADATGQAPCLLAEVAEVATRPGSEPGTDAGEELKRRAEQQAAIAQVGRKALRGLNLDVLLEEACAAIARGLSVELATVFELQPDGETLRLRAGHGWNEGMVGVAEVRSGLGTQARAALAAGAPVMIEDLADEHRSAPSPLLLSHGAVCGMSVAIAIEGRSYGILGAHTKHWRTFVQEDVDFVEAIANVLAAAIERHRAEETMRHRATHDELTGLPNRAMLLEGLGRALARSRRHDSPLAVLFADLDRFKVINDSLGHAAGDRLLSEVATRLRAAVRGEDMVGRLGGDEFVVICEDVGDVEQAEVVAGRMRESLSMPFLINGREVFSPASIGITIAHGAHAVADSLIQDADAAMYLAKARGGARSQVFEPSMRPASARLETEADLRRALERRELRVYFEPLIDLETGRITGAEALLRWEHPIRGLVAPAEFIPLAEETGLIVPIGHWVLEEACQRAVAWRHEAEGRPFYVSVNLSARQLADESLPAIVRGALGRCGLDPHALMLEITETFLVQDREAAMSVLAELKLEGVRTAVDDFGTGYSSLSYLRQFPVDTLKLDRSFVSGLGPEPEDSAIVAAMVSLARTLGLRAVAEGVETVQQLSRLRKLGCHEAQGYLVSRAQPAELFGKLLLQNPRW